MHRTAAVLIALVAVVHLVGQHLWLGESPVWFNSIFLVWFKWLGRAVDQWVIGLVLAFVTFGLAWFVGVRCSLIAALLFFALAAWDAYGRYNQVQFTLADDNLRLGVSMIAGAIASDLAFLIAIFAVVATMGGRRR